MVEFKPGLFGLSTPNNFGIFVRRFRDKNTKKHVVELYTLKGNQKTNQTNITNSDLGKSIPLKGEQLPETRIIRQRLENWISELSYQREKMKQAIDKAGKPTERGLWVKIHDKKAYEENNGFTVEELASLWYELPKGDISQDRTKKINEELKGCSPFGQGYFDLQGGKPQKWQPISKETYKAAKKEISELGHLRNLMFEMVEVPVEDTEDEDDTEMKRMPIEWENVSLSKTLKPLVTKLQGIMSFFVVNDTWPNLGLDDTHIYAIDGFSLRSFISYLAEDWINEGRTSYADAFVKFLIRTKSWNDSDALLAISQRNVKLAPNFSWEIEDRIEDLATKYQEPKEQPEIFDERKDLRELESYTIDPPTAKDFDDAITLEKTQDGYILWVHIADVAYYVEKDSSLDLHARSKGTSVYLPTKTLPMLPSYLSDNLCSLREQTPRLAMSVEIHYNKNGSKLLDKCQIHNSIILVDKNLSYDEVNQKINHKEEPFYSYHQFVQVLKRYRKGLALETDDVRLELGGQMALSVKTASDSTKMIETFMVAANETIAEILQENKIPVVYRNHPLPDKEDVTKFNAQAEVIGLDHEIEYPDFSEEDGEEDGQSLMDMLSKSEKLGGGGNISFSLGSGTDFAEEMKKQLETESHEKEEEVDLGTAFIKGLAQLTEEQREEILKPFREAIHKVEVIDDVYLKKLGYLTVLKTLSRALYGAGNMGHFGLGSPAYLHFTSPIRRYPDIIAHRVCKAMIANEEQIYTADEIDDIAIHCTEQSEIAEKLEKTIIGAGFSFLTRNPNYTENRQGIVVSIFGGGVFVLLPNGIEARIPISKITSRPTFVDDFETMCFVGSRSDHRVHEEITPQNWKELLGDDEDEPVEVITKIGDKITVEFVGWNHVEGKVEAAPITIYEKVDQDYLEKEFELSEEELANS